MPKRVNEHLVKISTSKITIPNELNLGDEVTLVVQGDVTKIEQEDNQDGTYDQIYIVKGIIANAQV